MFEAEEAVGETYAAKYDVGMGKYKFASLLCCCFNLSLFLLLFVLIFSFSTGGAVYTTVVGEDTRMDVALLCVPTPKAELRICASLEKNAPVPDGYRLMTA